MSREEIISRIYAYVRKGFLRCAIVPMLYGDYAFRMSNFRLDAGRLRVDQERFEPEPLEWNICNKQIAIEEFMDEYLIPLLKAIEKNLPKKIFDDNLF